MPMSSKWDNQPGLNRQEKCNALHYAAMNANLLQSSVANFLEERVQSGVCQGYIQEAKELRFAII